MILGRYLSSVPNDICGTPILLLESGGGLLLTPFLLAVITYSANRSGNEYL